MPFYISSKLIIYPVKSLAGIVLNPWQINEKCFRYDRKWMIVDKKGQCLTQRRLPRMALIKTALTDEQLILSVPQQQDLRLPLIPAYDDEPLYGATWCDPSDVSSVSLYADSWLSRFLNIECRLIFLPDFDDECAEDDNTHTSEEDGLSTVNMATATEKNQRVSPRYVRDDITVAVCKTTPLSFGKEIFIGFVNLNDISSRGVSFSTSLHIKLRQKIILNLRFHSGIVFKITAMVVHRSLRLPYQYGVKFDVDNHKLGDHLLTSQRTLIVK